MLKAKQVQVEGSLMGVVPHDAVGPCPGTSTHVNCELSPLDLAVVVVNHSSGQKVLDLLGDLEACRPQIGELVIVDNGREAFPGVPPGLSFSVKVIKTENRGFGAAVNEGVRHSRAATVCIINPDVRIRDQLVLGLLCTAVGDRKVGIAAPLTCDSDGSPSGDVPIDLPSLRTSLSTAWSRMRCKTISVPVGFVANVTGAFLVIRREVWDALGGFDERYFMYFEDADLCARVGRVGLKIQVVQGALVEHEVGGTPATWEQRRQWYRQSRALYFRQWRPLTEGLVIEALASSTERLRTRR